MVLVETLCIWIFLVSIYSLICCLSHLNFNIFFGLFLLLGSIFCAFMELLPSKSKKFRTFFTGYNEGKDSKLGGYYDRGKED